MASLSTDELVSKLIAEGQVEWEVDKNFLIEEQALLIQEMAREFSQHGISRVFNTSQGSFEDASLESEFSGEISTHIDLAIPIEKGSDLSIDYNGTKFIVLLTISEPVRDSKTVPLVIKRIFELMYAYFFLLDSFESKHRPLSFLQHVTLFHCS